MSREDTRPCSSCAYWEPYPEWEGVGTCDNVLSRNYGRMSMAANEHCEYYTSTSGSLTTPRGLGVSEGNTCEECHHWLPYEMMPHVGICDNRSSRYYRRPAFSDKHAEGCFATRSLKDVEFMWCRTHRETFSSVDISEHRSCDIFVSSAILPVEDEMELTVAGD